jgi:hypothetical protein
VEAFAAREDSGSIKLKISGRLPFQNVEKFVLLLNQNKLECLTLHNAPLLVGDICRAVELLRCQILLLMGAG